VTETGCGWNVLNGEELAELIKRLADNPRELAQRGKIAREVYERRFRKEYNIQEYAELLER
jgi:glycosyltransferase involved in cell wall biosynthesis